MTLPARHLKVHRGPHTGVQTRSGTDVQTPPKLHAHVWGALAPTTVQCSAVHPPEPVCTPTDVQPAPSAIVAAKRALDEAGMRGWRVRLANNWPVIHAPLATMSPALVDRLHQFADAVAFLLREGRP
jgi:hypothetical protein